MRLLDISERLADLATYTEGEVIDSDGVVLTPEDIERMLADLGVALEEKVEGCVRMLRSLEAESAALKVEEARLAARRRARETNVEALREYVLTCLERAQVARVKTATHTVSLSAGRPHVVYDDATQLPEDCVERTTRPLSAEVARRLKAGEPVPGAHLESGAKVLTIR